MTINIQCVYGNQNTKHIEECIIPNLSTTTKQDIIFLTLNYQKNGDRIKSGKRFGVEIIDIEKEVDVRTGFAENHNILFEKSEKTESFVLINPDCIPIKSSIDNLISEKKQDVAIVEGRQWPFEHPKEYNRETYETPWASGAFELIDSNFYNSIGGMDEIYYLYDEDVDLSWQAWLNGYKVIYNPKAPIIHFTNGNFYRDDIMSDEEYYSSRNFLIISRKFFGADGEKNALNMLSNMYPKSFVDIIYDEYLKIRSKINSNIYSVLEKNSIKNIKILGVNKFAEVQIK